MLWNDKVELIEAGELKAGQIVRFSHGYTREDRKGKAELHLGNRSQIEVEPKNIKADEYPLIGKFATRIGKITKAYENIHLTGTVKELFPASTFTRGDMSTGTVMRFTLADETGEILVVVWNEKAEELEKSLKVNANLQLVNAKVKENANGKFEVHVDSYTYVEVSERLDF
jgi:ssDNA-binding replication factor A large subunit